MHPGQQFADKSRRRGEQPHAATEASAEIHRDLRIDVLVPISGDGLAGPGSITGYGQAGLLRTRDCRVRKSLSRALCGRQLPGDCSQMTQPLCAAIASPASVHYTV